MTTHPPYDPNGISPTTLPDGSASASPALRDENPAKAAFLLQLDDPSGSPDDGFRGRIQHLSTLDGGNFNSTGDLVDLVRRILERARRDP